MHICVNCGLSFDEGRFCSRCGYILRPRPVSSQPAPVFESRVSRPVSSQPAPVFESRVSRPVEFVSNTVSRPVSRPRSSSGVVSSSLVFGFCFLFIGLLLATIFFFPSFGLFGELGGEFGELGGEFGELGGEFGDIFSDFGGRMGSCPFDVSSLLFLLLVVFFLVCFLIPGVIFLLRSKQRDCSPSVRWD
ncbi:MAG: hypothetical protein ACXADY_08030 [Candidatus Hodarchaeales archaeon]